MNKKIVFRTDLLTRKKFPREKLIRICITKNGETLIDYKNNIQGRGIYFKRESLDNLLRKNILKANIKRFNGKIEDIENELNILSKEESGKHG